MTSPVGRPTFSDLFKHATYLFSSLLQATLPAQNKAIKDRWPTSPQIMGGESVKGAV